MGPYDHRNVTLDPGLTVLALRGLREHDGHYPFIERFRRRRQSRRRAAPAPKPRQVASSRRPVLAASTSPRPETLSLWQTLFGRRRLEAPRPSSPAAA